MDELTFGFCRPIRLSEIGIKDDTTFYPYSTITGLGRFTRRTLADFIPLGEYIRITVYIEGVGRPIVLQNHFGLIGFAGKLKTAYKILQEKTFMNRLSRYLDQLKREGSFEYSGLRFTAKGFIESSIHAVPLNMAKLSAGPFIVYFNDFNMVIRSFSTEIDADVFFLILQEFYGIKF